MFHLSGEVKVRAKARWWTGKPAKAGTPSLQRPMLARGAEAKPAPSPLTLLPASRSAWLSKSTETADSCPPAAAWCSAVWPSCAEAADGSSREEWRETKGDDASRPKALASRRSEAARDEDACLANVLAAGGPRFQGVAWRGNSCISGRGSATEALPHNIPGLDISTALEQERCGARVAVAGSAVKCGEARLREGVRRPFVAAQGATPGGRALAGGQGCPQASDLPTSSAMRAGVFLAYLGHCADA